MAMKNRIFLAIAVASVLLLGAVIYRDVQVAIYPTGGGQLQESPDGRFEASAFLLYDEDFWGHRRQYYELQLADKTSRKPIKTVTTDLPLDQRHPPMRGGKRVISWTPDSSEATFTIPCMVLKLKVKP